MKKTILFFLLISASSCKTNYNTVEFRLKDIPPAPDYSKNESWAVLPSLWNKSLKQVAGTPEKKRADVFYIYPTLFSNKKSSCWNANIFDPQIRKDVIEKAVTYQASAWVKAANLYVPFYRQAHYRIFIEPYATQGREAGIVAYQDVKNAFIYFLNNYNNISWNTYKKNHLPSKYNDWYKGGVVSNPISWDQSPQGSIDSHLGVLGRDKKIYPNSLYTTEIDGILWSSLPKIKNRFLS